MHFVVSSSCDKFCPGKNIEFKIRKQFDSNYTLKLLYKHYIITFFYKINYCTCILKVKQSLSLLTKSTRMKTSLENYPSAYLILRKLLHVRQSNCIPYAVFHYLLPMHYLVHLFSLQTPSSNIECIFQSIYCFCHLFEPGHSMYIMFYLYLFPLTSLNAGVRSLISMMSAYFSTSFFPPFPNIPLPTFRTFFHGPFLL